MKGKIAFFLIFYLFIFACNALAADIESRLNALEETIKQQGETIEEQQRVINELKEELTKTTQQVAKTEEKASAEEKTPAKEQSIQFTGLFGSSNLANPNISLILDTFGYSSNLTSEMNLIQEDIPGYYENKDFIRDTIANRKGFNIDSAELVLFAPVDPYFNLYATIPVTEDGVELEEAYFVTTSLPYGFQLKGGKFKSGFGRINSQHPHAWDFADHPACLQGIYQVPRGSPRRGHSSRIFRRCRFIRFWAQRSFREKTRSSSVLTQSQVRMPIPALQRRPLISLIIPQSFSAHR